MASEVKIICPAKDLLIPEEEQRERSVPIYESRLSAGSGFPSPAEIFSERRIDLHLHMVRDQECTFIAEIEGESMIGAGIMHKSWVVVDRSVKVSRGCMVVAVVNNEFRAKFYQKVGTDTWLVPANPAYKPLKIDESHGFFVWGVITWIVTNTNNIFQLCMHSLMETTSTSAVRESFGPFFPAKR
jgi:DNA polymerase V